MMKKHFDFELSSSQKRGDIAVFSLPQTNHYHTISDISISHSSKIINENKWGNKVVVFSLNDVVDRLKVSFSAELKPFQKEVNQSYQLSEYRSKSLAPNLLQPNRYINGADPSIKSLAKKIAGKEMSINKIVKSLYYFTLEYLSYGKPIDGLYPYNQAIGERRTDCGGFSTFLASLLQALHIPNRLVVGFLLRPSFLKSLLVELDVMSFNFRSLYMHVWLEVFLPDKTWFPLDASIEWQRNKGLISEKGGFGFTPADRLTTSFGQDFDLQIGTKSFRIDLLQKPIFLLNK